MNNNIRRRKGFTIVELVIVIAVIGILTAVLIPTFISLNKKAEEASNKSFVKNLNTQLAIREAEEGKNPTMYEAMQEALEIGFDVEKLNPVDGMDIVWDSVANRFALIKGNEAIFSDGGLKGSGHQLWKIYDSMPAEQTYSIYAKQNDAWGTESAPYAVTGLTVGFDVGRNSYINKIAYDRSGASSKIETVIRTNYANSEQEDANLSIKAYVNGENCDVIRHYGLAGYMNVIKGGAHSVHTYGNIGFAEVASGKLVAGNGGVVVNALATGADAVLTKEGTGIYENKPRATSAEIKTASEAAGSVEMAEFDGKTRDQIVEEIKTAGIEKAIEETTPAPAAQVIEVNTSNDFVSIATPVMFERDNKQFSVRYTYSGTITFNLNCDVELHGLVGLLENANVTINMKGHKFNVIDLTLDPDVESALEAVTAIQVSEGATLSMVDSVGTGGFMCSSYFVSGPGKPNFFALFYNQGSIVLNGGSYWNKNADMGNYELPLMTNSGTVTIESGTVVTKDNILGGTVIDNR